MQKLFDVSEVLAVLIALSAIGGNTVVGTPDPAQPTASAPLTVPRDKPRWRGIYLVPGWRLMSSQERLEYRERMRAMKSLGECRSFTKALRDRMDERARERGEAKDPDPLVDACAGLRS